MIDQKDTSTALAQSQAVLNALQSNQDRIAVAKAELDLLTASKASRKDEIDLIQYKIQLSHTCYTQQQQDELLTSRQSMDDLKTQVVAHQQAQQQMQQEVKSVSDGISRDMATGLEALFKGGGDGWQKMLDGWHTNAGQLYCQHDCIIR